MRIVAACSWHTIRGLKCVCVCGNQICNEKNQNTYKTQLLARLTLSFRCYFYAHTYMFYVLSFFVSIVALHSCFIPHFSANAFNRRFNFISFHSLFSHFFIYPHQFLIYSAFLFSCCLFALIT